MHHPPGGDISPCWVFDEAGTSARIERYVPLLPSTSDARKLERLLKDVATYRPSLGRPRQEEILKFLAGRIPATGLEAIVQRIRVDLTPLAPIAPGIEGAGCGMSKSALHASPGASSHAFAFDRNETQSSLEQQ